MALRSYLHSTFDPRRIPGLAAWYDAADSASITLDSGRVSQWSDKSGNARHATNTTSGSTQPSYSTAARNGLNVLRFAAASVQRLTVASSAATFKFLHDGTECYFAAVSVYGTSSNPDAAYALFGNNGNASANRGVLFAYDDRNIPGTYVASDGLLCFSSIGGVGNPFRTTNASVSAPISTYDNIFTPQAIVVQEAVFDADNATASQRLRVRLNGGSELAANPYTTTPSTENATLNLQIGANGNNLQTLDGDICELLFFNQLPTAAARDLIRRYLGAKWGVTVG
jgi:hypothetical protein